MKFKKTTTMVGFHASGGFERSTTAMLRTCLGWGSTISRQLPALCFEGRWFFVAVATSVEQRRPLVFEKGVEMWK